MISAKPAALVMVLALAGTLPAQGVTVKATSLTELRVLASSASQGGTSIVIDTLPANLDITAGATLHAESKIFPPSFPSARADLGFSVEQTPTQITVLLGESGNQTSGFLAGSNAKVGPHKIRVEFSSPRPMRAKLIVRQCVFRSPESIAPFRGSVDIGGQRVEGSNKVLFCADLPIVRTFEVVIDSGGLELIFNSEGEAFGGGTGLGNSARFVNIWELELVPDPTFPCEIESYGNPCGATLTATSDFQHPGQHVITLEDSSRPPVAILGLGVQRQAVPIVGGCLLYHDLLVLLPWSIDPNGKAVLVFDPPAIPGLTFKAQAATLQGGTLHTTNALDVICR